MTVVFGPMSVVQGSGSALEMGVGLLAAGVLTAVPQSHRLSGFAALVSLAVGVLLIVAGYKLLLDYSGNERESRGQPPPDRGPQGPARRATTARHYATASMRSSGAASRPTR